MPRLFIYGTLRRDRSQHHRLQDQRFVGEAVTVPEFRLLNLGWYPGLARVPLLQEGRSIWGEIWEVDDACLQALDVFEGDEYERTRIQVSATNGVQPVLIEAYVLLNPDWSRPDAGISWDQEC